MIATLLTLLKNLGRIPHIEHQLAELQAALTAQAKIAAAAAVGVSERPVDSPNAKGSIALAYAESMLKDDRLARQIVAWSSGVGFEIEFWERVIGSSGGQWTQDFETRLRTDLNNPEGIYALLGVEVPTEARILDVGAGPMTVLMSTHHGEKIDLVAVDPLAPVYDRIIERYRVPRPVPTGLAFAEDLSAVFAPESFDAVHCRNALDHSFDPMRGIEEMLAVLKPQRRVLLLHNRNEAERENYSGFHQWNFDCIEDRFVIWNREERIDVTARLAKQADVLTALEGEWLTVTIIKKTRLPVDDERYRERLQALLRATLIAAMAR